MTEEEIKAAEEERKEIQREEAILVAVTECVRAMRRHGVGFYRDRLRVIKILATMVDPATQVSVSED